MLTKRDDLILFNLIMKNKSVFVIPQEVLIHHVSGSIKRGEGKAIVEIPAPWSSICADLSKAVTKRDLEQVEARATHFYNAGLLSPKQLKLIDVAVMEKLAELA